MKRFIFIITVFLSTPALAHVEFSEAYNTCMAIADGNVAIKQCMAEEADRLGKQVEDAYTAAMTRAIDQDQPDKEITPYHPEYFENAVNLQKSQKAFKAHLDAECNRRMMLFGMGSGAGTEYAGCVAELRTQRLIELKN